jgi:hypothetical protein
VARWDITFAFDGPFFPLDVDHTYPATVRLGAKDVDRVASKLEWRKAVNGAPGPVGLPAQMGLYVIVDHDGEPVYAGEAAKETIRQRFDGRAAGVHELGLSKQLSPILQAQQVWAGSLGAFSGTQKKKAIHKGQHWLIRYLLIRDYERQRRDRRLVNNKDTHEGLAPDHGMRLTFTTPAGMDFLWKADLMDLAQQPTRVANPNDTARVFTYTYTGLAPF